MHHKLETAHHPINTFVFLEQNQAMQNLKRNNSKQKEKYAEHHCMRFKNHLHAYNHLTQRLLRVISQQWDEPCLSAAGNSGAIRGVPGIVGERWLTVQQRMASHRPTT